MDQHSHCRPVFARLFHDQLEAALGQRLVGLVLQVLHAAAEVVVAHQADERRHRTRAGDVERTNERRWVERSGGNSGGGVIPSKGPRRAVGAMGDKSVYAAPEMVQQRCPLPSAMPLRMRLPRRPWPRAPSASRAPLARCAAIAAANVQPVAVRMASLDARADELRELAVFKQQVHHFRAWQVAAFDDHGRGLQAAMRAAASHVSQRPDRHLREHFRFGMLGVTTRASRSSVHRIACTASSSRR